MQRAPSLEPCGLFASRCRWARRRRRIVACARDARARSKITLRACRGIAMTAPPTLREISCADDYDPNSMAVDRARALIRQFLTPVTATERVHVRAALESRARRGRDRRRSPCRVTTIPRWTAGRCASRTWPPTRKRQLKRVGESFAGKPSRRRDRSGRDGAHLHRRRHAGGRRYRRHAGARAARSTAACASPPGAVGKAGQNRRFAGEDLKQGQVVFRRGQPVRPAELGMIASLGINEVSVYRRLRVAFFSTGDELRSIGTPLAEGEIYDSNRYTLYGMLARLELRDGRHGRRAGRARGTGARVRDRGRQRRRRDHVGRRLGRRSGLREAAPRQAGRGAVLEDRDEARPPARVRQDRRRAFLRPARQSGRR